MDYQTQQFKVIPLIATAYAMTVAGRAMFTMLFSYKAEAAHGKFDSLPEVSHTVFPQSQATTTINFSTKKHDVYLGTAAISYLC